MSILNERIKEMRTKRGLTLIDVADYLGVKEATVQRYESGNIKNIKHDTICKLADYFECDPSYLMGWTNDAVKSSIKAAITNSAVVQGNNATNLIVKNGDIEKHELSEQATELLRIFGTLSIKYKTELLAFAYKLEEQTISNSGNASVNAEKD